MGFAENLRELRKERGLSQEDLAELLDVSRQAVSKWEQGMGYPEVETLLLLAGKLNISLDSLMAVEIAKEGGEGRSPITGTILISSPHENVVVSCYKIGSSGKMLGGEGSPQYSLFGVSSGGASFWGEPTTFLGWYADKETISKEVEEIRQAIFQGEQTYQLKYSVKTERRWGRIKQVKE
ncbi:MAG: helix-turn-helix transcriptional regulator [Ruminiclostridium sp.]|nr:helix-turn-helix transcriptional regulator [Ruminiclostridium sp.]